MGVLGRAGSEGVKKGPDTDLTRLVLVGQVSQGYKWATCPNGANMTLAEHIEAAAGITLIFSLLFLFMSI